MGGKRPDQNAMHPGATNYATRTDDEHIHEEDKQALNARTDDESGIPERGENPALSELKKARREQPDSE